MGEWVEQFALGQGGQLRIQQHAGAVRIRGVQSEQATVKANWPGTAEMADRLRLEHRPGVLEVEVQAESRGWFGLQFDRHPVDLQIEVPVGTACVIETGSGPVEVTGTGDSVRLDAGSGPILVRQVGNVTVDGGSGQVLIEQVDGDLRLDMGSGPLVVREVVGSVVIDAGSGNQLLEAIQGPARIDVGSGRVEIRGFQGPELRVDAGSGDLRLYDLAVTNLSVEAGSGRILVDLAQIDALGRYEIDSGSGGVTVNLPSDADLEIEVEYEGSRLDLGGLQFHVVEQERGQFRGRMGHGGARLKVETSGGVRFQPRNGEQVPHGDRRFSEPVVIAHEMPDLTPHEAALAHRATELAQHASHLAKHAEHLATHEVHMAHLAKHELNQDHLAAMHELHQAHHIREERRGPTLREILDLVAEGKLSPAEADLLISRLEESAD
jgi:DUF4097 and DUF4098 domain-containing protein YvlB